MQPPDPGSPTPGVGKEEGPALPPESLLLGHGNLSPGGGLPGPLIHMAQPGQQAQGLTPDERS